MREEPLKRRRQFYGYEEVLPGDELQIGKEAYVYFVQPVAGGLVKIGTTRDPQHRMRELHAYSPERLALRRLLRVRPADQGHAAEAEFHRRFAKLREHGEWFRVEGDLIRLSNAIPSRAEQGLDRLASALRR